MHMWTESTMSIGQSLIISAMGISVVFLALVSLARDFQDSGLRYQEQCSETGRSSGSGTGSIR